MFLMTFKCLLKVRDHLCAEKWPVSHSPFLAVLDTSQCGNVKHYSLNDELGCPSVLSHTHSVTCRFNIRLFPVIKKNYLQGGWQLPRLLIRQNCLLAHYEQLKWVQCCARACPVYLGNYLLIIQTDCLIRDCHLADLL